MTTAMIKEIMKENNGIVTARQVKARGIASWYLSDMVKKGKLERYSRGVYCDPVKSWDSWYMFQATHPSCIFSYQTALYMHDLTERYPIKNEVTVCQGYNSWRIKDEVIVHQIKKEWHQIGVTERKTSVGNYVKVYDMERTMIDLLRDWDHQDPEIFSKAWKFYFRNKDRDVFRLREYAMIFGVSKQLGKILEVINVE